MAQAVLTGLNVGDVMSGSPLHLKLREVMIAYRADKPEISGNDVADEIEDEVKPDSPKEPPRYFIFADTRDVRKSVQPGFHRCNSLVDALDMKEKYGGVIFERFAQSTAEKVFSESEWETKFWLMKADMDKVIQSCYYRTKAGFVHWKQGESFGTSVAKNTEAAAYEEAIAAIKNNAGVETDYGDDEDSELSDERLLVKPSVPIVALTPEEAEAAYEAAPAVPLSEARISEIVKFATSQDKPEISGNDVADEIEAERATSAVMMSRPAETLKSGYVWHDSTESPAGLDCGDRVLVVIEEKKRPNVQILSAPHSHS